MRIKHYTCFTDSHKVFLKYFLNTFPFNSDIDLTIRYMPQESETGDFETPGFAETMYEKVKLLIDCFQPDTDIFIYSDADVIFFDDYKDIIIEEMGDADMIFQSDVGTICMGFFACRVSEETKQFFIDIKNQMHNFKHDQLAAIDILSKGNYNFKTKLFSRRFFNFGMLGRTYMGEDSVTFPDDMVMLHANFTETIQNKKKMIQLALKQYNMD